MKKASSFLFSQINILAATGAGPMSNSADGHQVHDDKYFNHSSMVDAAQAGDIATDYPSGGQGC